MGDSFVNKAQSRSSPPASHAEPDFRSLSPESRASSVPIKSEVRNPSAEIARPVSESTTLQTPGAMVIVDDTEEEEEEGDDGDEDGVGEIDSMSNPADLSGKGHALPLRAGSNNTNDSSFLGTRTKSATVKASRNHKTASREESNSNMAQDTQKQTSGQRRTSIDDNESELSEPDSDVHSPMEDDLAELDDEMTVHTKANGHPDLSPIPITSEKEDETMADVEDQDQSPRSHYPKRKRVSKYSDYKKATMAESLLEMRAWEGQSAKLRASRQTMASLKGVLLGQWRDSTVPDAENRHAVIGFIDSRDRLRTRIQRSNVKGDPSGVEYPLPPGPGGSWVTLDRIIFFPHLVGLNHIQIKEYVKLRADAAERSDEERQAAEAAAVKEAIHRAKADPSADSITNPLSIAHGEDLPETLTSTGRSASKRRRVNGGAAAMAEANVHLDSAESSTRPATSPPSHARLLPGMSMHGALHGSRPTRILLGYWKGSSEPIPEDRHAVHGILGHNDMFRVKITKSTRDGRFVDGNFPSGAGALWIQYEEVEFEPHLKPLSRSEVKEYCRIRQYQIDHGETPPDRIANETKAVYEAQARVASGAHKFDKYAAQRAISHSPPLASETEATNAVENANEDDSNMNLRQTRRNEKRKRRFSQTQQRSLANVADTAKPRGAKDDNRVQSSESRSSSRTHAESLEKANALARKEIARVEAAQGRIDRHAYQRERAAVMAADAAAAAAVTAAAAAATSSPSPPVFMANGRASSLHESEGMQRLNKVWAAQESIRMKAGSEDAKIYDGIKYERKANGPFVGKLVSQGTIINIDGEDYVEYRVLTKPSFF